MPKQMHFFFPSKVINIFLGKDLVLPQQTNIFSTPTDTLDLKQTMKYFSSTFAKLPITSTVPALERKWGMKIYFQEFLHRQVLEIQNSPILNFNQLKKFIRSTKNVFIITLISFCLFYT
jgi:hypothetical protein